MKKEDIIYSIAGENIAAGQINSVYAHEALMNSLGHRRNILGDYENVGVGVSFGGHYKIYYTQNFYSR
ncbi:cysteine-rich secretory family protein [[Clostridium] sordellii ATCC 9714]|nr:cysteine-rich secretory family protein [[Clostridium] sordellii ATCC 9714] [Paeniclostridium sordellii ATCC 9714]